MWGPHVWARCGDLTHIHKGHGSWSLSSFHGNCMYISTLLLIIWMLVWTILSVSVYTPDKLWNESCLDTLNHSSTLPMISKSFIRFVYLWQINNFDSRELHKLLAFGQKSNSGFNKPGNWQHVIASLTTEIYKGSVPLDGIIVQPTLQSTTLISLFN